MTAPTATAVSTSKYRGSLLRYRVMAFTTGVMLVLLVLVAMPLKYFADSPAMVAVVGTLHGFLFMIYLLTALDLGIRRRWALLRLGLIMIAGTVPFASFVAERSVSREPVDPRTGRTRRGSS